MAIKITVSDTVAIKVAGTYNDDSGAQPFDFTLQARRLPPEDLRKRFQSAGETVEEFLLSVVTGWRGVKDDDGDVPFTASALQRLFRSYANMPELAFAAYMADIGAKAKN